VNVESESGKDVDDEMGRQEPGLLKEHSPMCHHRFVSRGCTVAAPGNRAARAWEAAARVRALPGLACLALLALPACRVSRPPPPAPRAPVLAAESLVPSPRLIVGRILAVDLERRFAFVELATDAPAAAFTAGTELVARTLDLVETARLQASPQVRGRTLGTTIQKGQPTPGDEVVWLAP